MTIRVFVSYAWENKQYRRWVRSLAVRLRADGVEARLDHWHLDDGVTVAEFMNREMRLAQRVLVLCSPTYRTNVHAMEEGRRVSGTGWESMLLGAYMVTGLGRSKLVAALTRGHWTEAAPDFLLGYPYHDLSQAPLFEQNYADMLRRLVGKTEQAPPTGQLPECLEAPPVSPLQGPPLVEPKPRATEPSHAEALRQLGGLLAQLYLDKNDTARVLDYAGIGRESITLEGSPITRWHAIVRHASLQNQLMDIVNVARQEFPGNVALKTWIQHHSIVK